VVAEIRDGKGQTVFQASPLVRRQPISAGTAQKLTRILEGAVSRGTGKSAAVSGYRVAGKTGTAQKVDPRTGIYSTTLFIGSFVGFVPAEDPRLCILVVIDEPQTEAWGGVVAAPVFRRVAEQVLPYLGVTSQAPVHVALAEGESIGVRRAGRAGP